jgi:hypothetical protein
MAQDTTSAQARAWYDSAHASLCLLGIELLTPIRKNMESRLIQLNGKLLLRKRVLIEAINDQLKNVSQIEQSRHWGPANLPLQRAGRAPGLLPPTESEPSLQVTPEVLALWGHELAEAWS